MYRLIIADDEENIRNGMAHSLPWREWGYEVVEYTQRHGAQPALAGVGL